jgi:hypothetical protein
MSMCLDVTDFIKDNMNARNSLEAKSNARGRLSRPRAPYCLKLTKGKEVPRWLKTLKFPDCHVANIK